MLLDSRSWSKALVRECLVTVKPFRPAKVSGKYRVPIGGIEQSRLNEHLIADDKETIANTLQMILARESICASAVYDGKAAIERAPDWEPDLFLEMNAKVE